MEQALTNRQIAFIILGLVVGYGVMGLPKNIVEKAGTGAWFTLLIGTIVTIIFTYIIVYLQYTHANKTIYEYSLMLTGKIVTTIIIIIYGFYFFMLCTMTIRISCEVLKQTILIKTPIWALSLTFFFIVYYAVTKKLRTIARFCEIYGLIIIISGITLHLLIFTQGELINLKPFFVSSELPTYFKASLSSVFPFIGIEVLFVIPFKKKENNKKIFNYSILMIAYIGFFYILIVESCTAVMGVDKIIHYKDALYATIRRVDVRSLEFLRRLDGIFLIAWIMKIYCTIITEAYATVFFAGKLFKKIKFKILSFVIILLLFIISLIPSTIKITQKLLDYIGYFSLFTIVIIPLILLVLTKVKKYDKQNQ